MLQLHYCKEQQQDINSRSSLQYPTGAAHWILPEQLTGYCKSSNLPQSKRQFFYQLSRALCFSVDAISGLAQLTVYFTVQCATAWHLHKIYHQHQFCTTLLGSGDNTIKFCNSRKLIRKTPSLQCISSRSQKNMLKPIFSQIFMSKKPQRKKFEK